MSRVGADERVPVPDSIHLFSTAACHPPHDHRAPLTIKVFPGASHKMRTGAGTRLASGYVDTLTRWIKAWAERTGINPDTRAHNPPWDVRAATTQITQFGMAWMIGEPVGLATQIGSYLKSIWDKPWSRGVFASETCR